MELRQLEYLVTVIETASFSAAARKLGVRQPSISEQIRTLETQLHQPLLDRLPGRVVPTPAGRQLFDHAKRILAEVADANRKVSDAKQAIGGPLVVGAIPTIAPFLFPAIAQPFAKAYPDVELSFVEETTDALLARLSRGEVDLAITSSIPPTPNLHEEQIGEEELVLMLPARHPLAKRKTVSPDMLEDEPFVALHEMHCLADQSAKFCLRTGLKNPTIMQGSSLFTLALMVAADVGVTLAPAMMAQSAAFSVPTVAFRSLSRPSPTRPIMLVYSILRYRPRSAREFGAMAAKYLEL